MGKGKIRKLGLVITEQLKRTAAEDARDIALKVHTIWGTPASWNWRNANGKNYTTPIQDQGDCGSCVAFGSTAALEVTKKVADQNPTEDDKLSEADLFSNGGNCSIGWTLEAANATFQSKGVCPERCWPYNGSKQSCCDGNKLKIFQRGFIQDLIVSGIKRERLFQVRERFMQVIFKIIEKRPGRSNTGRHLRNAQAAERSDMKLLKDAIAGLLSIKDPVIVFIYYPVIFLFKSEAA